MNIQPKPVAIIKAMLQGIPMKVLDWTFCFDENLNLCVEAEKLVFKGKDLEPAPEKVLLRVDWTVGEFVRYCNRLSDDEFAILCANIALNKF